MSDSQGSVNHQQDPAEEARDEMRERQLQRLRGALEGNHLNEQTPPQQPVQGHPMETNISFERPRTNNCFQNLRYDIRALFIEMEEDPPPVTSHEVRSLKEDANWLPRRPPCFPPIPDFPPEFLTPIEDIPPEGCNVGSLKKRRRSPTPPGDGSPNSTAATPIRRGFFWK